MCRTAYTNLWNVSIFGENDTVAVGGKSKMHTTTCPATGDWYSRFDKGSHKRMGDLTFQDSSWSPELLMEVMKEFESDWTVVSTGTMADTVRRNREGKIIFPALMGGLSYVLALRGEELPLMDLAETRINTQTGLNNQRKKHGVIALLGRLKTKLGKNII
jgi:hypothetical protein